MYELSTTVQWQFIQHDDDRQTRQETIRPVRYVRVVVEVNDLTGEPFTVVVPVFEDVEDWSGLKYYSGLRSYEGFLNQIGYRPVLSLN